MNERMYDAELAGFLGYCTLMTHGRIVKDAYMAPDSVQLLELLRLSQQSYRVFQDIERYCEQAKYDIHALLEPATGLYDEMESRLRPGNWAERVVKTYVVFGIISDCMRASVEHGSELPVSKNVHLKEFDTAHETWSKRLIQAYAASEPQMQQLLSLWGRRVFGEGLGMVRGLIARYPDVAKLMGANEAEIVDMVQERHRNRMEACGLVS